MGGTRRWAGAGEVVPHYAVPAVKPRGAEPPGRSPPLTFSTKVVPPANGPVMVSRLRDARGRSTRGLSATRCQ